ncbi:hypothetical protein N234_37835 [Ralstonia pickettii DTP0602]|nr:hypothetical protein N234_37835 [Ralstonia pickettii DTP0602]
MSCTLSLEAECLRLRLRAGAELVCRGGSLWLTFEARDRPSPDILLAPGERYRLHGDAEVFLAALHGAGPALCEIEAPPHPRRAGRPWLSWFRWLQGARVT